MPRHGPPMLFAPPRPPVMVPRSRPVVIGRTEEADLIVNSKKASRKHAIVKFAGDEVIIEDLESTNGTQVNGEMLVGAKILQAGDRIEIAGTFIHFYFMEQQLDVPLSSDTTASFDAELMNLALSDVFRGDLGEISIASVLQMIDAGLKSGVLWISTDQGACRLWVQDGRPVHAEAPAFDGFDAALFICHLQSGLFAFDSGGSALEQTLDVSITELLLEASRRRDERNYRAPKLPPEKPATLDPEPIEESPAAPPPTGVENSPKEPKEDHEYKEWWKEF